MYLVSTLKSRDKAPSVVCVCGGGGIGSMVGETSQLEVAS